LSPELGISPESKSAAQNNRAELIDIANIADIQAHHLKLNSPAILSVPIPEQAIVPSDSPQLGLYGKKNGQWLFIGNKNNGEVIEGNTESMTEIKIAADLDSGEIPSSGLNAEIVELTLLVPSSVSIEGGNT